MDLPTSKVVLFVSHNGIPMAARLMQFGDAYTPMQPYSGEDALEFYDLRYPFADWQELYGFRGQFITRYYVKTLQDHPSNQGLDLWGSEPQWTLSVNDFQKVMEWVHDQYKVRIAMRQHVENREAKEALAFCDLAE